MVSNARELLPEPETPVITTNLFLGMITSMFFRLCSLAPFMMILLFESSGSIHLLALCFEVDVASVTPAHGSVRSSYSRTDYKS